MRAFPLPSALLGETLRALNLPGRWSLSAIAVRHHGIDERVDPDRPFEKGDVLVLMGEPQHFLQFTESLRRK